MIWQMLIEIVLYWIAVATLVVATLVVPLMNWLSGRGRPPAWFPRWLNNDVLFRVFIVCALVSAIAFFSHSSYFYFS